jgi:hypothetical protein
MSIPKMIGKRIRPRARGRKRSAASRERMRQAAQRRSQRQAAIAAHEAALKRNFFPLVRLRSIRNTMEGAS